MKRLDAHHLLRQWDEKGRYVFSLQDLTKIFHADRPKALMEGLRRLVRDGLLVRACRGVYVNPHAKCMDTYVLDNVALTIRRGDYNYLSLESMLSEYGAISQVPIDRLTIMTTGRKGTYATPYGVVEFTHTRRTVPDILFNTTVVETRPLRLATPETAWRDLKRTRRNTHMVMDPELHDG
jgi:predicted transcriptional regulator of viral defense system